MCTASVELALALPSAASKRIRTRWGLIVVDRVIASGIPERALVVMANAVALPFAVFAGVFVIGHLPYREPVDVDAAAVANPRRFPLFWRVLGLSGGGSDVYLGLFWAGGHVC